MRSKYRRWRKWGVSFGKKCERQWGEEILFKGSVHMPPANETQCVFRTFVRQRTLFPHKVLTNHKRLCRLCIFLNNFRNTSSMKKQNIWRWSPQQGQHFLSLKCMFTFYIDWEIIPRKNECVHTKKSVPLVAKISNINFSRVNVLEFVRDCRSFFAHLQRFFVLFVVCASISSQPLHVKRRNHHQKKALIETKRMMFWCLEICFELMFSFWNKHFLACFAHVLLESKLYVECRQNAKRKQTQVFLIVWLIHSAVWCGMFWSVRKLREV